MSNTVVGFDFIKVYPRVSSNQVGICTKNTFFSSGEIVVEATYEKIVFRKPTLESTRVHKCTPDASNWYRINIVADIPIGTYLIDKEDSNEDELVVYFKPITQ